MTRPALHTRICDLFGVRYPIVQTGMGWVAGPRLTAATSEAGGLGILASATMTYDQLRSGLTLVNDLMTGIVHFALALAPYAVPAMIYSVIVKIGVDILIALGVFVLGCVAMLLLHHRTAQTMNQSQ